MLRWAHPRTPHAQWFILPPTPTSPPTTSTLACPTYVRTCFLRMIAGDTNTSMKDGRLALGYDLFILFTLFCFLRCFVLFYFILFYFILFYFILFYFILFYFILFYFYFILFYH